MTGTRFCCRCQDFAKCDFAAIRAYLDAKKEEKKAATKDDKEKAKLEKEALQRKYGFAILDHNRIEKARVLLFAMRGCDAAHAV